MGKLLEFPSQQAQGLAFLDRQLRAMLKARGADDATIDFAASALTRIYAELSDAERYSFSIQLPLGLDDAQAEALASEINQGLDGIRRENHALMLKLIAQLVLAEVRLFQHERS
ncbi:MAG: hypothetical protein AAGI11_17535 [Pseudomonadota bacterium]